MVAPNPRRALSAVSSHALFSIFLKSPTNPRNTMKFRKKPVIIEAIQYDGSPASGSAACNFMGLERVLFSDTQGLFIDTLEGTITAAIGDWIIKGVKGEFYPCKDDIFEATYEAVDSCENSGIK